MTDLEKLLAEVKEKAERDRILGLAEAVENTGTTRFDDPEFKCLTLHYAAEALAKYRGTVTPAAIQAEHTKLQTALEALELIAVPKRSDGTYNRSREACGQLARDVLEKISPSEAIVKETLRIEESFEALVNAFFQALQARAHRIEELRAALKQYEHISVQQDHEVTRYSVAAEALRQDDRLAAR